MTLVAAPSTTSAHVESAVKKNNRYIKLTVFGDRVRLAYIIYFGEIPGAKARQEMDTNHDGTLSPDERTRFGKTWAQRVKEALAISIGSSRAAVQWKSIDVGLDPDDKSTTAFTVDLVAWLCVGTGARRLELLDRLELANPGETEVLPEESPGTELTRLSLGPDRPPPLRFDGLGGPLETDGLILEWSADDTTESAVCRELAAASASSGTRRLIIIGAGFALALIGAVFIGWRRRKKGATE